MYMYLHISRLDTNGSTLVWFALLSEETLGWFDFSPGLGLVVGSTDRLTKQLLNLYVFQDTMNTYSSFQG